MTDERRRKIALMQAVSGALAVVVLGAATGAAAVCASAVPRAAQAAASAATPASRATAGLRCRSILIAMRALLPVCPIFTIGWPGADKTS